MKRNDKTVYEKIEAYDRSKDPTLEPVQALPLEVKIFNGNFDKAFKAFRAIVQKERILSTYKEKQSYEKPSDRKRRKRNEAKKKILDAELKAQRYKNQKEDTSEYKG